MSSLFMFTFKRQNQPCFYTETVLV